MPFTFVLDAGDAVFDVALERLVGELEARPGASFVYTTELRLHGWRTATCPAACAGVEPPL